MNRERLLYVLAALVCAFALGCQGSSEPPAPAAPEPTPDEKVLRELDCHDPMYQVDEAGRVIKLRLVWRHLPGPVLAEVGKLTHLQAIDLAFTTVTNDGLAQLKDLQELKSMGLSGTPITDEGLVHLEKLRSLQWVWLSKQTVTQAGVDKLKEARPDMNVYLQ